METIKKIKKRDGSIQKFDPQKITKAIWSAAQAVGGTNKDLAKDLTKKVIQRLKNKTDKGQIPTVETVQDIVESRLVESGHYKTAKAYILYRSQHNRLREFDGALSDTSLIDNYIKEKDWRVKENSNMSYSLQGLNVHIADKVVKKYWLEKIYPPEVRKEHNNNFLHIHDLGTLGVYCVGWDLEDILSSGFKGVRGKIESGPAKHFNVALLQVVNYIYTLQGESAGAQALSNFDTLLAPFIRYDDLSYKEAKQCMQEFLYNMNVPTRVGFQTPFSNVTMDLKVPSYLKDQSVIIGGKPQDETYGEFQEEVDILNRIFAELMLEGDAKDRPFTFPIPTYNITKDFEWDNETLDPLWEMTSKYGTPYFSNFINSDMKPEDARSMCCRLRLDNKELRKRGGGLFGSNPLTGSIGVVTLNMPRIAYLSSSEKQFFNRVGDLMEKAKKSLEIKREVLEDLTEKGMYPYSKFYLRKVKESQGQYWKNHFSTIGLIGVNDALMNLKDTNISTKKGSSFAKKILDFMRDKLGDFQKETGDIFNLEATPAEGSSYRLARNDKKEFGDIKIYNIDTLGKKEPVYTNSTQLPFGLTDDIFEALDLQDPLQSKYTGGCIEKGNKVLTNKGAINIENIVNNFDDLKPIKVLSYNPDKGVSEWDKVKDAMRVNVEKHDKVRIKAERGLDITTSDWHPFFIKKKIKPTKTCPICNKNVKGIKGFANHIKNNSKCRKKYENSPNYKIVEKRADELKKGDYILQNSQNLYPDKDTKIGKDLMWLIGFFVGDGCISRYVDDRGGNKLEKYKIRFFSEHKKPLEKTRDILKKHFGCKAHIISNDKRSNRLLEISTSKKEALKFFFDIGFSDGEKVYDVLIPKKVKKNLNKNNVFDLLSGLADSDGHIDKKQGDFEYYTISKSLADDLVPIFSKAGLMVGRSLEKVKRDNEKNIYRIRIPNYEFARIKDQLTITVNKSRINENISNRVKRHFSVVRVQDVSKVDVEDNNFYDLTTQKNHNYLAGKNTMVFIHNTVFHTWLGEKMPSIKATKNLVKKIAKNYSLPYYTLTPTFSICPNHGYINGEEKYCPKCKNEGKTTKCEVYSRVVGYLRPVEQWNEGKQEEFKDRANFSKSAK